MIISDINYLQVAEQETKIIGGTIKTIGFIKHFNATETVHAVKNLMFDTKVNLEDHSANANAGAYAGGKKGTALTTTYAETGQGYSSAASASEAASEQTICIGWFC